MIKCSCIKHDKKNILILYFFIFDDKFLSNSKNILILKSQYFLKSIPKLLLAKFENRLSTII